jgi:hypothetical protein
MQALTANMMLLISSRAAPLPSLLLASELMVPMSHNIKNGKSIELWRWNWKQARLQHIPIASLNRR